jgi:hypothetical protein
MPPTHYIYDTLDPNGLCQGDVLRRTPGLTEVLSKIHPHYGSHTSYRYFLVLTQTCDLVRRDGKPPSSAYITLAAVRPIEDALRREARKYQDWWQEPLRVIDDRTFNTLALFTERVLDNNEPSYFYLHEDLSLDLSGRNCAFLALSVALRAEHYNLCLAAKTAQLKETFRAKLGWLVGNMYSRVGTQEWNDHYGKNDARRASGELLNGLFVNVAKDKIAEGVKELKAEKPLDQYAPQEIFDYVKNKKIVPKPKRFADRALEVVKDVKFTDMISSRVATALANDQLLANDLQQILANSECSSVEDTRVLVMKRFADALGAVLRDSSLPDRDKIVNRIVSTIQADAVIQAVLK